MKKHMMRVVNANVLSKFFKATVFVLAIGGTYATTYAAPLSYATEKSNPGFGKAAINHLGGDNESLLFEVKLENTTGERFVIIIKDKHNHTIYRGWFSDKDFAKKFRLPKSEDKLSLIIRSESGSTSEIFEINASRRVVEDVVVKKVI